MPIIELLEPERKRLCRQFNAMRDYLNVLEERIEAWKDDS